MSMKCMTIMLALDQSFLEEIADSIGKCVRDSFAVYREVVYDGNAKGIGVHLFFLIMVLIRVKRMLEITALAKA